MVGDMPSPEASADAGAVEREAAEAAEAAARAAAQINDEVRAAEAQVTSGGNAPQGLPAPAPVSPTSLLGDQSGTDQRQL